MALESAQAYNRVKPPHQTVGDAVMMSLHHASHQARKQREKGMVNILDILGIWIYFQGATLSEMFFLTFEKMSTLKGKNLGANFLKERICSLWEQIFFLLT